MRGVQMQNAIGVHIERKGDGASRAIRPRDRVLNHGSAPNRIMHEPRLTAVETERGQRLESQKLLQVLAENFFFFLWGETCQALHPSRR